MGDLHKTLILDELHAIPARVFADIAARDADTAFHSVAENVNKIVRVDSPLSFFVLGDTTPTWVEFTSTGNDTFLELTDTPSSYSGEAFMVVRVNAGETALEFSTAGQGDVVGTVPSTDNALPRYDGISGLLIQNSLAILTDVGALSGLTQLTIDDIRIDDNIISTLTIDRDLILSPNGLGRVDVNGSDFINAISVEAGNLFLTLNTLTVANTNGNLFLEANGTGHIGLNAIGGNVMVGSGTPLRKLDVNGNLRIRSNSIFAANNDGAVLNFSSVASAVNNLAISNAISGGEPKLIAQGADTDIGIDYITQGIGFHNFLGGDVVIGIGSPVSDRLLVVAGTLTNMFRTEQNQTITRWRADNTETASLSNTFQHSAHLNIQTTGLVEASRIETQFTDIGQLTNDSELKFYTRLDNSLSLSAIIAADAFTVEGPASAGSELIIQSAFGDISRKITFGMTGIAPTGTLEFFGRSNSGNPIFDLQLDAPAAGVSLGTRFKIDGNTGLITHSDELNATISLMDTAGVRLPTGSLYQEVYPVGENGVLNLSLRDRFDRSPFGNDAILEGTSGIITGAGRIGSGLCLDGMFVNATTITSVTDSSGIAEFNFTVGPTLSLGQVVTISGFATNTAYNGDFAVIGIGVGTFQVGVAFGSDETGSFKSASIARVLDNASLQFTDLITVEAWIFPNTDGSSFQPIISKMDTDPGNGWNFVYFNNALRITFRKNNNTGISDTFSITASVVPTSVFTYVAFTYNNTTNALKVYVNADLIHDVIFVANTGVGDGWDDSGDDLIIGSRLNLGSVNTGNLFDGDLSNVRVYNRVLEQEEIRIQYLRGSNYETQSAIVADRWKALDTSGNPWIDFNKTDRFPLLHTEQVVDVYSVDDLPAEITAPDGVLRRPLASRTKYIIHRTFVWPRLLFPQLVSLTDFEAIELVGAQLGVNILIDGDTTPHFWGRKMSAFQFQGIQFVDVGNSGAGKSTTLFDFVAEGLLGTFSVDFVAFFNFLDMGVVWNMPTVVLNAFFAGMEKGIVFHSTTNATLHSFTTVQGVSAGVVMETPVWNFNGDINTMSWVGGNDRMISGDSFIGIDSVADGIYDIIGVSFSSTNGDFFEPDAPFRAITAMADASVAITSFADSVTNPGVDTTCFIGAYSNIKPGQTVLIQGATQGNLNGTEEVVRVADDELSFDINVVFVTSSTATLERTRFTTSGNHGFVEGQSVTITGTTAYNTTEEILLLEASSNNTFVTLAAFSTNEAAGNVATTSKDEKIIGVKSANNGVQKDSKSIASVIVADNATDTVISTEAVFVDLNLGSNAVVGSNIERWSLDDINTAEVQYDDDAPFSGMATVNMVVEPNTSSTFSFRMVKNGSILADASIAKLAISGTLQTVTFIAPITADNGDLFRMQVAEFGGTTNPTITDLTLDIE